MKPGDPGRTSDATGATGAVGVVTVVEAPPDSLLQALQRAGNFTDCYALQLPMAVTQAAFVEAFYTSPLFKLERWILGVAAARPSTDEEARALAQGRSDTFSAWRVTGRSGGQLLLTDMTGRTSSWLWAEPTGPSGSASGSPSASASGTRLHFGSVVRPRPRPPGEPPRFGAGFHALLGFHRLYSRGLLGAAARRLLAGRSGV
jgi:hypothetical protein